VRDYNSLNGLQQPDLSGHPPVLSKKHVLFVCHSTGGIVVRYMLCHHPFAFKGKDIGLALIASPSRGSVWANVAGLAAKYYNQTLGQQLAWRGELVEDIHKNFKNLIHRNDGPEGRGFTLFGMEACESKMIFRENVPKAIRVFLPPRWVVVTTESAGQYFQAVTKLPDTDHFSTVKPDGLTHPSHEFLERVFREFRSELARSGAPGSTAPASPSTPAKEAADVAGSAAGLGHVRNNLQASLTSFVGREAEIEQIMRCLSARLPRLITLVGPGGSGKTRLALQVAEKALESPSDEIWFVPLAEVPRRRAHRTCDRDDVGAASEAGIPDSSTSSLGTFRTSASCSSSTISSSFAKAGILWASSCAARRR
jgi:hypothetical protein